MPMDDWPQGSSVRACRASHRHCRMMVLLNRALDSCRSGSHRGYCRVGQNPGSAQAILFYPALPFIEWGKQLVLARIPRGSFRPNERPFFIYLPANQEHFSIRNTSSPYVASERYRPPCRPGKGNLILTNNEVDDILYELFPEREKTIFSDF
jgi:hypothetical protein